MYRALISFSGLITMAKGEVREISDNAIAQDLLQAKYIEKIKPAKQAVKVEQVEKPDKADEPEKPKKKATKKSSSKKKGGKS